MVKAVILENVKDEMIRLGVPRREAAAATSHLAKFLYPREPMCDNCKSRSWNIKHWDGIKIKFVCGEFLKTNETDKLMAWLEIS